MSGNIASWRLPLTTHGVNSHHRDARFQSPPVVATSADVSGSGLLKTFRRSGYPASAKLVALEQARA